MADFENGDYVTAAVSGSGRMVRGYGRVAFNAGQELQITSRARGPMVNVKLPPSGSVFSIERAKLRHVTRSIGEVPDGGIAVDDPRIAWMFEDAGRLADRLGLCRDYDRLCDALGAPGRLRTFTLKFETAQGIEITAKVLARSKKLAEETLRGQMVQPASIKAITAANS